MAPKLTLPELKAQLAQLIQLDFEILLAIIQLEDSPTLDECLREAFRVYKEGSISATDLLKFLSNGMVGTMDPRSLVK